MPSNQFSANAKFVGPTSFEEAILRKLKSSQIKKAIERNAFVQIEKAVYEHQNLFRPDKCPGGGEELIALLGIGEGGHPDYDKITNAWKFLVPVLGKGGNVKVTFSGKKYHLMTIEYKIDIVRFYLRDKSTYVSKKSGEPDFNISWMNYLIEGIPTIKFRDYPPEDKPFVMVGPGDPNFRKAASRTGLGVMVPSHKVQIPAHQFVFNGLGRHRTFDVLINAIEKRISSPRFKAYIKKEIAKLF